jgi:hypothetical protein
MKFLPQASIAALAALWACAALGQSAAATPHATRMDRLAVLLDLTDAQKPQVQSILEAEHAQMRALWQQVKSSGTQPDFQAMKAAHQQIAQDTVAKLSGVLNATQLKKFQTLQEMAHHRFGRHGGPGGGQPASAPPQN